MERTELRVPVEGATLHVAVCGEGPLCLVPYAFGSRPAEIQTEALTGRLRLAIVGLRGGAESTGQAADVTFDRLAEDFEAVRRALGAPTVAVLGISILGMLAIEYARRSPAAVSLVVTAGTPPYGDMARVGPAAAAFFAADASPERQAIYAENRAGLPPGASPGEALFAQTPLRFFDPRTAARRLFEGSVLKPELLARLLGELAPAWDPAPVPVPVLVTQGRYDYVVPHTLGRELAAKLGADFELFERSCHQPFYEEPDRFAQVVLARLAAGA